MRLLWREVENCPEAREIFSKQKPDGSWLAGGSWAQKPAYVPKDGYTAFTPKYVTAAWIVPILGGMGFSAGDVRVAKACDYMLSFHWPNGWFDRFKIRHGDLCDSYMGEFPDNNPCDLSVYLTAFGSVGMAADSRLRPSWDLLVKWQREDGGWINQKHKEERNWTRSCPAVTGGAVAALFHSSDPGHKAPLRRGLEFLVWHLSTKDDVEIRRFFYHGHKMVKEMLMLSETGVGVSQRPVRVVLDWLMTMYEQGEGCFRYKGKPISKYTWHQDAAEPRTLKYVLYHVIEDDWLTYYMTRIAANLAAR